MCRNLPGLFAALFFSLLLSVPATTWAVDIELAREEIQEARNILITLNESLTQRETGLQEREDNLKSRAENLTIESEVLTKEKQDLEKERLSLKADWDDYNKRLKDLNERERLLKEREVSTLQIEKDMNGLTSTLSTLSWHLTLAKIGLMIETVLVIVFIIL